MAGAAAVLRLGFVLSSTFADGKSESSSRQVVAPALSEVGSQHSSARIEKSNRRSRFGEPLLTTDCEDDDDLCEVLFSDIPLVQMDEVAQVAAGHKNFRKLKKVGRTGSNRFESRSNQQVIVKVPEGGAVSSTKQLLLSDGPNTMQAKPRSGNLKMRSSLPQSERALLPRKEWEEQAYQIIRRQKLRDAAVIDRKKMIIGQASKHSVGTCVTLVNSTENASLDRKSTSTQANPGVRDAELGRILQLLKLEEKCHPLVEYLHALGLQKGDFIRIVDRHKACLRANVTVVKERISFLLSVGVQFHHLPKLIVRHPQILEYRVDQAMIPRIHFLKSLGLEDSNIGKVITISPSLLECSLSRSLLPRITYLTKTVGINYRDLGKVVMRSPQILTQSIEDSLEPRVNFFINEMSFSKEAFAKMVTRHPQLLHYSLDDSIRPHVKYLQSIGLSDEDVLKVLTRLTQVLSLSIGKCLQPKYDYLVKELKGNVQTVISFPAYFSLSLDQRIMPRHKYLEFLEQTPEGSFPMRLLAISDLAFCKWTKRSIEQYDRFRHSLLLSNFAKKFEQKTNVQI